MVLIIIRISISVNINAAGSREKSPSGGTDRAENDLITLLILAIATSDFGRETRLGQWQSRSWAAWENLKGSIGARLLLADTYLYKL